MPDDTGLIVSKQNELITNDNDSIAEKEEVYLSAPKMDLSHWEVSAKEISSSMQKELVVAFIGASSAGKDAAIKALFGVDFGQIDPVPGSTSTLKAIQLDPEGQVIVINAPGFGDLRSEVKNVSNRILGRLDLAVFVVNADGGATADDKRNLAAAKALGRPVLVCVNKIDLIREHQREELVRTTLIQLGADPTQGLGTAFDPLPMLSEKPIGITEVIDWIMRILATDGKSLIFARQLRERAAACEPIIRAAARKAAMAGAIPVPGADMAALTILQTKLIADIATVYGVRINQDVAMFIAGEALAGAGKGFARWATSALKTAGYIPGGQLGEIAASALGAAISGATTYGVGKAAITYMEKMQQGMNTSPEELREVFDTSALAWRNNKIKADSFGALEQKDER